MYINNAQSTQYECTWSCLGTRFFMKKTLTPPLPPPSCFSTLSNTVPLDRVCTGVLGSILFPGRRIMFSCHVISVHNMLKHFVARQFVWLFQHGKDYIGNVGKISKPDKEKKRWNCATVRAKADSPLFFREEHRWNCK